MSMWQGRLREKGAAALASPERRRFGEFAGLALGVAIGVIVVVVADWFTGAAAHRCPADNAEYYYYHYY